MRHIIYIALLLLTPVTVYAQNPTEQEVPQEPSITWERHESITGIYETKFPEVYSYNVFPFQYNDTNIAFHAEIFANINDTPEDKEENEQSVFIRSLHTIGSEMSYDRAKTTLERLSKKYIKIARALKGQVLENEDFDHNGYLAKKIYITYNKNTEDRDADIMTDPSDRVAMRIRLYTTNYAIIEQVVTGPAIGMYSYKVSDFLKSIKLIDGIGKADMPLGTGWREHVSKTKTFTVSLPPKNKDYTPHDISFKAAKSRERAHYKIIDPVADKELHYLITMYKMGRVPTNRDIKNMLMKNHISKFLDNLEDTTLSMKKFERDGHTIYETSVVVSPIKSLPYISHISYEVAVKDRFVLVKEFFNGAYHQNSGIHDTFFKMTKFHPENYTEPKKKKPAKK